MKKRVTLEETKRACLDMLTDFDAICKKYDLKYSIYYGTLLGAVRHKGFIPWDDDVDVVMPRPDYERLVGLIQSGAFKEDKNHDFFMDRGKGAYYNFLKFMDTRYPIHCPNHIESPYLFLDVFPLDGVPDDDEEFKKIYRMDITITPAKLTGVVIPPPSKSQAHRALIAAALADGESVISNAALSQDIAATLDCLEHLGAGFARGGSTITVRGMSASAMSPLRRMAHPRLDCGESGSTLRFLIPVALAARGGGIFSGRGRLMERPLTPYFNLFDEKGVFHERKDGRLTVAGLLTPGEYRLPGDVSSQFVTGLLYALPLLDGDSQIVLTSPLESRGYVDMTLGALSLFGVSVQARKNGFFVPGNQLYQPRDFAIEADWSQAAFWYAARFLGSPVEVGGMDPGSAQGDRVVTAHARDLAQPGDVEIDVSGCPDLVPPLAAMAAARSGAARLTNAARLRLKESDRLDSVTRVLGALGADVEEGSDFLTIRGRETLRGGVTVDSFNDHRVAMMAAIAATRCEKPVTVTGAECVAKSYPDFWEDYEKLGGKIRRL